MAAYGSIVYRNNHEFRRNSLRKTYETKSDINQVESSFRTMEDNLDIPDDRSSEQRDRITYAKGSLSEEFQGR